MPDNYDPTVVQGDTLRFTVNLRDPVTGATFDLSGATLSFQMRKTYLPGNLVYSTETYITGGTTLYVPNGITGGISSTTMGGTCYVAVGAQYINQLPTYTGGFYGIRAQKPNNGGYVSLLNGRINIEPSANNGGST